MRRAGSRIVPLVVVALILTAAWIRVDRLGEIDLYGDEAMWSEIASSLWKYGELNPLRDTDFLPDWYFRNRTFTYFPPLSYVFAAPFTALRDRIGPNVAPRLPALLGGLITIALLLPAARAVFADTGVGLAAAALTVGNGFHIGMSGMALPYSLVPPVLLLSLLALVRAVRRDRVADWIGAGVTLTASAYINQVALLFWALMVPCALTVPRHQRVRVGLCFGVSGVLFLVWVALLPRRAFLANAFFQTTAGYEFGAQLAKLAAPYQQMLAPWPLAAAFAIGLVRLVIVVAQRRETAAALLLTWVLVPGAILLTHSMWILEYHLYIVYPAVVLVAAYGTRVAVEAIVALGSRRRVASRSRDVVFATAVAALCGSEWWFAPPAPPRSAAEFGSPQIVSAAAAYIRAHDRGEDVIAPAGPAEAYYLERFVHSKNHAGAEAACLELVARRPAWVFMGDNYFHRGRLDACDDLVRRRGTLIMHSAPLDGITDAGNSVGYALYHLDAPTP